VNGSRRARRRILHTSDLHLVSPGDKPSRSLTSLVDLAIRAEVDLLVFAGDLFDHNRVDDELVIFAASQLRRVPVNAVILPGNHDCLMSDSVYEREILWQDCANVRVLRDPEGERLDFPYLGISLWGKPIMSYDDDVLPLAGAPQPPQNGHWNIAVAHGFYASGESPSFRSYHITEQEIVTSGYDYIALGHIASFRCVCEEPVKAYYSGAPTISGTVSIVELSEETGVQVTPYSLSDYGM